MPRGILDAGNMEDVCAMIAAEHAISTEAVMDKLNRLSEVRPQPQTLHPNPETRIPKPETRNPKPETGYRRCTRAPVPR